MDAQIVWLSFDFQTERVFQPLAQQARLQECHISFERLNPFIWNLRLKIVT